MSRLVCVVCLGTLLASTAKGQVAGVIGVYTDSTATSSVLIDDSPGTKTIYVVHMFTPGSKGARFKLVASSGFTCSVLGETYSFPMTTGTAFSGIEVLYESCIFSPILLVTIELQCFGTSSQCSNISPVPHPSAVTGEIEVTTCDDTAIVASGMALVVNCSGPIAALPSTWGRIKALFAPPQ